MSILTEKGDFPSCLDSAYERQACIDGSNTTPVFPENKKYVRTNMIKGSKMDEYRSPGVIEDYTQKIDGNADNTFGEINGGGWHMDKREAKKILAGVKYDDSKPDYSLLPPEALEGAAGVFTMGAAKYGKRNWENGISWGRVFAALMRHMWAWWRGENVDPESGLSHLHHAACNIMMLQAYETRKLKQFDDRPGVGQRG